MKSLKKEEVDYAISANKEARNASANYRSMIARTCVTAISGVLTVLGFLVGTRQTNIISEDILLEYSLYASLITWSVLYLLILRLFRVYSLAAAYQSELIFNSLEKGKRHSRTKSVRYEKYRWQNWIFKLNFMIEVLLFVAVLTLLIFAIQLVRKIAV